MYTCLLCRPNGEHGRIHSLRARYGSKVHAICCCPAPTVASDAIRGNGRSLLSFSTRPRSSGAHRNVYVYETACKRGMCGSFGLFTSRLHCYSLCESYSQPISFSFLFFDDVVHLLMSIWQGGEGERERRIKIVVVNCSCRHRRSSRRMHTHTGTRLLSNRGDELK